MAQLDKIRLSGTTYDIIDATAVHSLDGYWTTGETTNAITAATNALAESIAEQGYQTSGDVQNAITAVTNPINNTLTVHTANTDIHVTIADKTAWNAKLDESDVAGLFGNVAYDSTAQRINFYHESTGGTVLAYIDASDFVKDAFLDTVVVENRVIEGESVPCLVFTWNTDAGKSETVIPIGGTFDPSNYYTKTEIDNIVTGITEDIEEATSGKADVSTTVTDVRISADTQYGFVNLNAYKTINGTETTAGTFGGFHSDGSDGLVKDDLGVLKVNTNVIQEKLSSGTNIKTINGTSILGSGNLDVQTLPTVQGTTLIFS